VGDFGVWSRGGGGGCDCAATLSELVVVAEEFGRRLAPAPLVESLTAVRAISRVGAEIPDGLLTFAPRPLPAAASVELLPAGALADGLVGRLGADFVLAEFAEPAPLTATKNLGSLPLATRRLGTGHTVLGGGDDFEHALEDWKVLTAAALVGLTEQAHEMTVAYVKQRTAFGVPIGWFQTVAHKLADAVNDLDGARFAVHKAAWAVDAGSDRAATQVSIAYAFTCALSERVTAECLHFHGGIGYTQEHDIQMFFRRAKAWPLALGDPRGEYGVLADQLLGPRSAV
jgi:Acyl-CoA dehydrogenase, C-terminal domain